MMLPPLPVLPVPADSIILPPFPAVADPVSTVAVPLDPELVVPVEKLMCPLMPSAPPSTVFSVIPPLDVLVPALVTTEICPPVSKLESPASTAM